MYICWLSSGVRYFANDTSVIFGSNNTILVVSDLSAPYAVTTVFAVGTVLEALEWVRNGTTSGV